MTAIIGQPVDRKDGKLKVTGTATYAAEFPVKNIAYGVTVQSTITNGHIENIDVSAAKALKGVLDVMTYKNAMSLHQLASNDDPGSGKFSEKDLLPLQSERIFYNGQHIAVVIAESFEIAEHAASLINVAYNEEPALIDLHQPGAELYMPEKGLGGAEVQKKRGDAAQGMSEAEVTIEETYNTPVYHHNPIEPHATLAEWDGDQLTVYDATQSVYGNRAAIAGMLGVPKEKVRLISPFIGGGFGSKGFMWANSILAPMAAKLVNRPVKIVLQRTGQMFTCAGRRSFTIQKIGLGADKSGKLKSIRHDTISETSFVDEFVETAGIATKMLYDSPNLEITQRLVRLNKGTPCPTRAPGEAPGTYAFEVAMDELAYKLNMDPLQLRLLNYAEKNPDDGHEWSGKNLRECYEKGAKSIGWAQRNNRPGVSKEGDYLVGYGMATATYPANRSKATVGLKLYQDGHAVAACGTQDIGTGTYTVMAQVLADALGLPVDKVEFKLGDTIYPQGPNSGGSQTMATTGPAVRAAGLTVKSKVIRLAIADKRSPLYNQPEDSIMADNGKLFLSSDRSKGETYSQILIRNKKDLVETQITTNVSTRENQKTEAKPVSKEGGSEGDEGKDKSKNESRDNPFVKQDEGLDRKNISFHSFGAHFVKILVDPATCKVKVDKIVTVMDVGRILNYKTAKSQIMGGAIFGIGMALMEGSVYDPVNGRIVTKDLADYLIPVHADMPVFDIQFIDKPDQYISPVGARGAGEIGITGITAAIANAVYHATGKRVRDLPITTDKLL
ncbi:MAG TPA: xanthine dehydrogenase family protein molybdopterin-binding subunit [Chitinophagaceae bacterium]